jgi:hypothetical protein
MTLPNLKQETHLPAQVKVTCLLEVPPLSDTDPAVVDILLSHRPKKQGPLNYDQVSIQWR